MSSVEFGWRGGSSGRRVEKTFYWPSGVSWGKRGLAPSALVHVVTEPRKTDPRKEQQLLHSNSFISTHSLLSTSKKGSD